MRDLTSCSPDGSNLLTVIRVNSRLRQVISSLLSEFGLKLALRPHDRRIEVQREHEDIAVLHPYTTLSDSLQRLIFHLAAVYSNKDSVIAFEDPEVHAFPRYIRYLAERVSLDSRNQYFITTHSPYFLTAIAEKTHASELAIYLTYIKDDATEAKLLSRSKLEEMLSLDLDIFFNLDRLLG